MPPTSVATPDSDEHPLIGRKKKAKVALPLLAWPSALSRLKSALSFATMNAQQKKTGYVVET